MKLFFFRLTYPLAVLSSVLLDSFSVFGIVLLLPIALICHYVKWLFNAGSLKWYWYNRLEKSGSNLRRFWESRI